MNEPYKSFKETEMTKLFDQFNILFYMCGLKNFWIVDLKLPAIFVKVFDRILIFLNILMILLLFSIYIGKFTQTNLSPRQASDLNMLCLTTPVIYHHFYALLFYKKEIRKILYHLVVLLKEHYSDKETELQMVKRMKLYVGLFASASFSAIIERGFTSLLNVILYGEKFNPFVTGLSDINDSSSGGLVVRLINYFAIWCYAFRSIGTYGMIQVLLMSLSNQFKDLQSYFYSLDKIFEDNNLSQKEKENKYEAEFKRGIYLHILSLWCVRQCQHICRTIFNLQLMFSTGILIVVLRPLVFSAGMAERLPHVPMLGAILVVLAIIMWNSGNITFEAQRVSNAMYSSGWQNCYGMSSRRIRKLVANAMLQAQQPVVLTVFGIIQLSYENYVKVVKSSYSVFSVFY